MSSFSSIPNAIGTNTKLATSKLDNSKYMNKYLLKNKAYRPIAQKLITKFEIFRGIQSEKILFIESKNYIDNDNEDKKPNWIMRGTKATPQLTEYTGYYWIIESLEWRMLRLNSEQVVTLIYSMIKYIAGDSLIKNDTTNWYEYNKLIGTLEDGCGIIFPPIATLMYGFTEDDFRLLDKADGMINIFEGLLEG